MYMGVYLLISGHEELKNPLDMQIFSQDFFLLAKLCLELIQEKGLELIPKKEAIQALFLELIPEKEAIQGCTLQLRNT